MSSKHRKKYSSSFKLKVALAAIKGEHPLSDLCQEYGVHASMIQKWRKKLLDEGSSVFDEGQEHQKTDKKLSREREQLQAKIGELLMERDFLKKKLDL